MKLTASNLYLKEVKGQQFVLCIELPDHSRNYIHSQEMILSDCMIAKEEITNKDIEEDADAPYVMMEDSYYRIHMTISSKTLSLPFELVFHSRKLNLNDAVVEHAMLIKPTEENQ